MDIIDDQCQADKLRTLLRQRNPVENPSIANEAIISILSSVSATFSISYVSYDLMKWFKTVVSQPATELQNLTRIIALVTSKYALSFRPNPKDIIEIIKALISADASWAIGQFIVLLQSALRSQQGNPKNNFLTVSDELIPVISGLSADLISANLPAIQAVVTVMFASSANMACVSAYLSARGQAASQSSDMANATNGKKRKGSVSGGNEVYVSHLFEKLGLNYRIAKLVLAEYIARKRRISHDNASAPAVTPGEAMSVVSGFPVESDDTNSKEEFQFFSEVLSRCQSVEAQIELWALMSDLRIYKLRDDFSDEHKSALKAFLDTLVDPGIDAGDRWRGLGTVLSIDPVNFTDEVCELVWTHLRQDEEQASADMYECLFTLFRTFAIKGSVTEVVKRVVEASAGSPSLFRNVQTTHLFRLHNDELVKLISGPDLLESIGYLSPLLDGPDGECARQLMLPLVECGCGHIPENLLAITTSLLTANLEVLIAMYSSVKKSQRGSLSALVLATVDGIRKTAFAWAVPTLGYDKETGTETALVERSLTVVAKKDPSKRCSALIRLSLLCNVDVSVDDLLACDNAEDQVTSFVSDNFLNCFALIARFRQDDSFARLDSIMATCVTDSNYKALPDSIVPKHFFDRPSAEGMAVDTPSTGTEMDSLIAKSAEIVFEQFPRVVFTPVSLRRSSFPSAVLAVEASWANQGNADAIAQLVARVLDTKDVSQRGSLAALHGLTVVAEEVRRNQKSPHTILKPDLMNQVLEAMHTMPLLAQSRFVLAVHGMSGMDNKTTSELLVAIAHELLTADTRDRPAIDAAYFCLFQGLVTGKDRRKVRIPWWSNKMSTIIVAVRGLVGCCLTAVDEECKLEAAHYIVRIWKTIIEGLSSEKFYRISKSIPTLVGEYIRLSGRITNAECASVLDRGCCVLMDKLAESEKQYLHAMLGRNDREALKRINDLLERNFKYTGKI